MSATHSDAAGTPQFLTVWRRGPATYLQLSRPQKSNAYTQSLLAELAAEVDSAAADPAVRVLVITGSGERAFCGGADRGELARRNWRAALDLASAEVFERIHRCPCVSVAAINGAAVGGGLELALACDIRLAASGARFWLPEPTLGLIPAAGGTQRLPRLVGHGKASELILGGAVWDANDALRFGLVSEVVAAHELLDAAQRWAERIAGRDPLALRLAKQALSSDNAAVAGQNFERLAQALLVQLQGDKTPG